MHRVGEDDVDARARVDAGGTARGRRPARARRCCAWSIGSRRRRATGMLALEGRAGVLKEVYFVDGQPQFVNSNVESERLGNFLIQQGALTPQALQRALSVMHHFGGRLADTLVGLDILDPLEAYRLLAKQVAAKLMEAFSWQKGRYTWSPRAPNPWKARSLHLDAYRVIGAGAAQLAEPLVDEWLRDERARVHRRRARCKTASSRSSGSARRCLRVYSLLDGRTRLGELAGTRALARGAAQPAAPDVPARADRSRAPVVTSRSSPSRASRSASAPAACSTARRSRCTSAIGIGMIGANGAGKSTLLAMIVQRAMGRGDDPTLEPDAGPGHRGSAISRSSTSPQEPQLDLEATIASATLAREGVPEHEIATIAAALQLATDRRARSARSRSASAAASRSHARCSAAPTCSRSTSRRTTSTRRTVEWLETRLAAWPGALIVVTHDRYFLDRVATRILEVDRGKVYAYEGDYAEFLLRAGRAALDRDRGRISARRRSSAARSTGSGAARRRARPRRRRASIASMPRSAPHRPADEQAAVPARAAVADRAARSAARSSSSIDGDASRSAASCLVRDLTLVMKPGDRIGIVGENGAGKTTLIRMILGLEPPDRGQGRRRREHAAGVSRARPHRAARRAHRARGGRRRLRLRRAARRQAVHVRELPAHDGVPRSDRRHQGRQALRRRAQPRAARAAAAARRKSPRARRADQRSRSADARRARGWPRQLRRLRADRLARSLVPRSRRDRRSSRSRATAR